jgi:hypothetical protein
MNIERVSARAVNSSGQSISNNSYTIVTYDAVKTFDTNSGLNTSTGVFTAPETGYYQVNAGITFAAFAVAASVQVVIHKNGSSTPL